MRILDRYLGAAVITVTAIVGMALIGISTFLAFLDELDHVGQGTYTSLKVAQVVLLQVPAGLYELFPIIVMLGTLMGLGGLASSGELVVMRASGISIQRIALSGMRAGLLLALLCFVTGEYIAPAATDLAGSIRMAERHGLDRLGSARVWLRDGDQYLFAANVENEESLRSVKVFELGEERQLLKSVSAERAEYIDNAWHFFNVTQQTYGPTGIQSLNAKNLIWQSQIDPNLLRLSVLESKTLSLFGLWEYINYLEANDLDSRKAGYAFWRKIVTPISVLVMIAIAVPFVMGPLRDTGAGQRLFAGVVVGLLFYVVNEVTISIGQVYSLAPAIICWLPIASLGGLAMLRLRALA